MKTRRVEVIHRSVGASVAAMPKQKPSASIDFGDEGALPSGLKLGTLVTVTLRGRITSADTGGRYGMSPSVRMEVTSCDCDQGMDGDLRTLKERRTMKRTDDAE